MSNPTKRAFQDAESKLKTRALTVPCPCGALVGDPCDRELSRARVIHGLRYKALFEADKEKNPRRTGVRL
jgi:hypothetical protein